MYGDGQISFNSEGLSAIQRIGRDQVEECNEIWSDVMSRIEALFPEGAIDAGLAGVLAERNEQYVRDVNRFVEDLGLKNTAIGQTRDIGIEGGEAMRRAARL
ncbi:hypothetical protein V1J52_00800 [Streptomyces sp. TRM 70351]|uniref:hypothetical protein n=1 Tax=Streptomyces sp. TRM 70351 TaxID=3116552 RepID=UPI002E7B1F8D|nr:hypothetical protein [Streptomyces sp. TRM 70351]MEE1926732.1 hypothetical protein [Streptomyces sp. TRM 70351]